MQRTLPIIAALVTLGVAPPVLGQCGTLTNVVTTSGYTDGNLAGPAQAVTTNTRGASRTLRL